MTEHQPELIPHTNATTTPEEQAKREEYRRRLAEYLKDPEFRKIEGFPIGTDEDILALSDPPYYTACPNPFLPEIIEQWQQEREEIREKLGLREEKYQREPFAADVSEGKNDPIYNAHSYHTKVPHKAIMRYILHYTDPGDIVFDGFCGTGMTGVAAQLCGDKKAVESLGYRVDDKGVIWEGEKAISRLGARKAVLNDLSPAATFIAYNYNTPVDASAFEREAKKILKEVEQECGWMYETWHPNCDDPHRVKGRINYTIWSEVFVCPTCEGEMIFWDSAVDQQTGYRAEKEESITCNKCGMRAPLINWNRSTLTVYDSIIGKSVKFVKRVPVRINYSIGKSKFEKVPDKMDYELIERLDHESIQAWYPTSPYLNKGEMWGDTWRAGIHFGITNMHHFYTKRNLRSMASFYSHVKQANPALQRSLEFWVESIAIGQTLLNRYLSASYSQVNRYLKGTMYIAPLVSESSPWLSLPGKLKSTLNAHVGNGKASMISTNSATNSLVESNSINYIFTDPPFGSNIMYSDLNFIWESWLKVVTNNDPEAIINKTQRKTIIEFQTIMEKCFEEYLRILIPGHWMTVEFHNSSNAVWNAIQETILRAGFVVADVRTLDKKQITMQQMVSHGAVKQDLIISAYKPNGNLEERFKLKAGTEDGAWEFVRYHLGKLNPTNEVNGVPAVNAERQAFLLFDRMVAFHIQRGVMVPLSAPNFYAGLEQHFTRRDGMYFLPDQVAEYDRAMLNAKKPVQLTLFVNDEKTAITWLRQQLDPDSGGEPKTQGDLTNDFNRVMNRAKHEQPLELIEILKQNFLQDAEGKWYVPDHNKATDLEKVRQRALLKEFKEYTESAGRLRVFRSEAVRAGFADCFKRQDYGTIVTVAERLPEDVLREDPDLLMYYDSALLRKK